MGADAPDRAEAVAERVLERAAGGVGEQSAKPVSGGTLAFSSSTSGV